MKAFRIHEYGQAPSLDDIEKPTVQGPLDVVVKIGAAGVCRTDLHVIEGQWEEIQQPELPYVLGHENAGWVESVGSAVTNVSPGDAVIMHPLVTCGLCTPCRQGNDSHCENASFPGLNTDGGMAEYMLTNARSVLKLDPSTDLVAVAALADAGLTAYHAVRKAVPLLYPGTTAIVLGAGGLGHIGIQVLKALTAAQIIVVDRSATALELAKSLGADTVINNSKVTPEDMPEALGNHGAEVVFDFIGEQGMEKLGPTLLKEGGSYFSIGYGGEIEIKTIDLISKEINVVGNLVGTYQDLAELMALTQQGHVYLDHHVFKLQDAAEAFQKLDSGELTGRAVLVP